MSVVSDVLPPRYENCERIGRGGMGDIYLAHDRQLGRKVAIKVLADRFKGDGDVRQRFTREALMAARLSGHPHIVTIFDVGEWNDRPHIVMEYLSGGNLAERNRAGRTRLEHALDWLEDAADALDAAHAAEVVHRDVKPANLLFDGRDELHVADFGIARALDQTTVGMTMPGTVMGTAGYLSPEQANGERATVASDIYSVGVVAFELLTGSRPFERRSATAEAAAHIHEPVPRATDRRPELPDQVDDVFARVLAKDPGERHATASEFVADLQAAVDAGDQATRALPLSAVAASTPEPPRARPPARRPWLMPALLALLLLGGGGLAAYLLTRDDGKRAATHKVSVVRTSTRTLPGTTATVQITTVRTVTAASPPPPPPPPPSTAVTVTPPAVTPPPPVPASGSKPSISEAIALTDQTKAANDAGDYATGLKLGRQAVRGLQGSGQLYEAYAYYNYGVSLLGTGSCAQAVTYFNRSEAIQGYRKEIARERKKAQKCASSGKLQAIG
jgi:eukaryotic-like serine/threonine-protein kinase